MLDVFPEFNTGIIVYRKSFIMQRILQDWLDYCVLNNIISDMAGLREAVLMSFNQVKFSILPNFYNEHGFKTMLQLDQKVKVIHERLSYRRKCLTPCFSDFYTMDRFAKKINRVHCKRLYIPGIGIIPYNYSPTNILLSIKKRLGYSQASKHKTL